MPSEYEDLLVDLPIKFTCDHEDRGYSHPVDQDFDEIEDLTINGHFNPLYEASNVAYL